MLRPSPNHGTQRLPNDDDDDLYIYDLSGSCSLSFLYVSSCQCHLVLLVLLVPRTGLHELKRVRLRSNHLDDNHCSVLLLDKMIAVPT